MLSYVTTNSGKVAEVEQRLGADTVTQLDYDYPELQADDLAPIAAAGARAAYRHADAPVIVDDAGLFIDDLDGFPGPYSHFVDDTLGIERVWRLTEPEPDHSAEFKCVIAYCDGDDFDASPDPIDRDDRVRAAATDADTDGAIPVKLFDGSVAGRLVAPRGDHGFGYDPIFEYNGTTFAEMTADQKNAVSHRGRALDKFAEWLSDQRLG